MWVLKLIAIAVSLYLWVQSSIISFKITILELHYSFHNSQHEPMDCLQMRILDHVTSVSVYIMWLSHSQEGATLDLYENLNSSSYCSRHHLTKQGNSNS